MLTRKFNLVRVFPGDVPCTSLLTLFKQVSLDLGFKVLDSSKDNMIIVGFTLDTGSSFSSITSCVSSALPSSSSSMAFAYNKYILAVKCECTPSAGGSKSHQSFFMFRITCDTSYNAHPKTCHNIVTKLLKRIDSRLQDHSHHTFSAYQGDSTDSSSGGIIQELMLNRDNMLPVTEMTEDVYYMFFKYISNRKYGFHQEILNELNNLQPVGSGDSNPFHYLNEVIASCMNKYNDIAHLKLSYEACRFCFYRFIFEVHAYLFYQEYIYNFYNHKYSDRIHKVNIITQNFASECQNRPVKSSVVVNEVVNSLPFIEGFLTDYAKNLLINIIHLSPPEERGNDDETTLLLCLITSVKISLPNTYSILQSLKEEPGDKLLSPTHVIELYTLLFTHLKRESFLITNSELIAADDIISLLLVLFILIPTNFLYYYICIDYLTGTMRIGTEGRILSYIETVIHALSHS